MTKLQASEAAREYLLSGFPDPEAVRLTAEWGVCAEDVDAITDAYPKDADLIVSALRDLCRERTQETV